MIFLKRHSVVLNDLTTLLIKKQISYKIITCEKMSLGLSILVPAYVGFLQCNDLKIWPKTVLLIPLQNFRTLGVFMFQSDLLCKQKKKTQKQKQKKGNHKL